MYCKNPLEISRTKMLNTLDRGMYLEITRLVPMSVLSVQYTLDRYRSICSAIKCPLEITADDYFVTSNGAVYDAIQAAYIVLRIMGY